MKNGSVTEVEVVEVEVDDTGRNQVVVVAHMNLAAAGNLSTQGTEVEMKEGTWGIVVDRMVDEVHTGVLLDCLVD